MDLIHSQPEHFTCAVKSLYNTLVLRGAAKVNWLWLTGVVDSVEFGGKLTLAVDSIRLASGTEDYTQRFHRDVRPML